MVEERVCSSFNALLNFLLLPFLSHNLVDAIFHIRGSVCLGSNVENNYFYFDYRLLCL